MDPYFWADISSNDSNSDDTSQMTNSPQMTDITVDTVFTPTSTDAPETPPSSDRSTPPNFDDLAHNIFATQPLTTMSKVTILPPINLCPIGQLSPILPNTNQIMAIKSQNEINLMQNNTKTSAKMNTRVVDNRDDLCRMRREARKIRNREAATISRKKKKEYVDNLEHKINGLVKENSDLKIENLKLKGKLADYETLHKNGFNYSFNPECKCRSLLSSNSSNRKATLSLLAVVFMLGLNLGPFSGVLVSNDNSISNLTEANPKLVAKHGPGRTLLSTVERDVIGLNASHIRNTSNTLNTNCKMYFNQTESLRMETDLRDWLSKVKLEKEEVIKYKQLRAKNERQLKNRFSKPIPLPRLKAWIQKRTESDFNEFNDYAIDSYYPNIKIPNINYDDLLSAIHRRDDTFYLLSYSTKDHLIIPPMSRNSSEVRPRFSLLIPLISTLNESLIRGTNVSYSQMSIMQIDCQVINTKMVLFNTLPNGRNAPLVPTDANRMAHNSSRIGLKNRTSQIRKNMKKK